MSAIGSYILITHSYKYIVNYCYSDWK